MDILVSCFKFKDTMNILKKLVEKLKPLNEHTKIIVTPTMIYIPDYSIRIDFVPSNIEKIAGRRPEYFFTDSYQVSEYIGTHCINIKELYTVDEIINLVKYFIPVNKSLTDEQLEIFNNC